MGSVVVCLGLLSGSGIAADNGGVSSATAMPAPDVPAIHHITDGQNRLISSKLSPRGEARSHASALYATAMLALDDPKHDLSLVLTQFQQIIALDPHFIDAQVEAADIMLQLGQIQAAMDQLAKAAAANPKSIDIQAALAYTQHLRGQNEDAVRLSKKVLAKVPEQATAMRVILEVASDQNDLAGGVLHVEDILKAADTTSTAWITLAKLYLETARASTKPPNGDSLNKTLLPIYQQAATKPPVEVETLTLLADTYRDLGRKRDALKTLKQGLTIAPNNVDLILRCADLETDLGQKADALKNYEKAYTISPMLTGLRETLGGIYLDNGKFTDAIRLFKEAQADSPGNISLAINLSLAYEGAHQPELAEACFHQVFASDSCPPEAYLQLAIFQMAADRIKDASATIAAAEKRFPTSAKVKFYEAIQHRYEKNYPAALNALQETRALAQGREAAILDTHYYLECAMTMNLAGQKEQFEQTLHEGLMKFPNSADLMNELAFFWADADTHLTEALALSKRAVELDPDNGAIQDTMGWVYFRMNDAKAALPYLQRAAILTNNDPVVQQHLGDTYLKLGLKSEAIAAWRRGLEKAPRNGDLASRIDAAQAQAKNAHTRSAPQP